MFTRKPSASQRSRRIRLFEALEQRQLLAVDFCEPLSPIVSAAAEIAEVDHAAEGSVTPIFISSEIQGGLYVPSLEHDDHDHLKDLDPNHPLRNSQSGFGRLDEGLDDRGRTPSNGGAAPNLRVTNTRILRDGNGALVESVPVGQMVAIQVNFATEGIPAGTVFNIRLMMDGVPIDYTVDWASGTGNWFLWWSGWYAAPGQHQLDVSLDTANQVSETDENDNSRQQIFTPFQATDLPQKLIFPVDGVRNQDFAITNYADMDPRTGVARDFQSGIFQYDGHNAWDLGPINFLAQDRGIPVIAAADGIVSEIADGNFDRKTDWSNTNANYVIIQHGNGWQTIYWHLARDSVTVKVGQAVTAGDVIGEMGSSGISTGTHIHYSLYRFNFPVESMYDVGTYYQPQVDVEYQPLSDVGALYSNISNDNNPHNSAWRESFPSKRVFTRTASDPLVLNFGLSHTLPGDLLVLTIFKPDGSIAADWDWTADGLYRFPQFYWWVGDGFWKAQVGDWRWQVAKDGEILLSESFTVTDGVSPGQIRVTDANGNNVNPGRTTPFDFLTRIGTQQSFVIHNHGDSPLVLSNFESPRGFDFVGALPSSVAPGGSTTFTVQFNNAFDEKSFGSVRFNTSDPDIPSFVFNVEGASSAAATGPTLDFPGPSLAYEVGSGASTLVDPTAAYASTGAQAGRLVLELHGDRRVGDDLQISHQGMSAGQVGVVGNNVYYGGVLVGTRELTGAPIENLSIVFNAAITNVAVNAILRRITFSTTSNVDVPRFLRGMVIDINGVHSTHAYKGIRVHQPVLVIAEVENIEVNAGAAQRSRVDSVKVSFSNEVQLDSSAFELTRLGAGGGVVNVNVSSQVVYGKTVTTLTFSGPLTQNGSLLDGNYELKIFGNLVLDARGNALDGDSNGQVGGDYVFGDTATDNFFRLFGDTNGDRTVGLGEFNQFRAAFGKLFGQVGYRQEFDIDNNGAIGLNDFNAFRARFGQTI